MSKVPEKGKDADDPLRGKVHDTDRPKVVFLFTGQGSQYSNMGQQLYETQPIFRQTLQHCDQLLRPILPTSLLSVLYPQAGESSLLDQTAYTQPALFALEYALTALWRSQGIEPAAVLGHSVGEYVAACVAGVFSLQDGLSLVAERARLMQALPQGGAMVAVAAAEGLVTEAVAPYRQMVSVAASNGPQETVISGAREAVELVEQNLQAKGIRTRRLRVSHAFHSPLMEPMLAPFAQAVTQVTFRRGGGRRQGASLPAIELVSNLTGQLVTGAEMASTDYWCRHTREAVRFWAGMQTLHARGYRLFVEIGPGTTLLGIGRGCVAEDGQEWLPSLRRGRDDWRQFQESLERLYARGLPVDQTRYGQESARRQEEIPNAKPLDLLGVTPLELPPSGGVEGDVGLSSFFRSAIGYCNKYVWQAERPTHLLTLSAKSAEDLQELAQRWEAYLQAHPSLSLADVCFTANADRSHFAHRLAIVGTSVTQVREQLATVAQGRDTVGVLRGKTPGTDQPEIVFLFSGQGSQYLNMGKQLYETQPVFRQTLQHCDQLLRPILSDPLLSVLYPQAGESSRLDETTYAQPALFAVEYALASLWRSWGIEPAAVLGHSLGEYVAACVTGVLSLEEGLKLVAERARLIQALPQEGAMVAVAATEELVTEAIAPYRQVVSVAASNGPREMVISGAREAIQLIQQNLRARGIKTRRLRVSQAFHSPLMEPMLAPFAQAIAQMTFHRGNELLQGSSLQSLPTIELVSNLTGQLVTGEEMASADYWCRHTRETVRFWKGMQTLHTRGYRLFVEIGPETTLLGMGRECIADLAATADDRKGSSLQPRLAEDGQEWLPSLRKWRNDWQQLQESLGVLYVHGVSVDWMRYVQGSGRLLEQLPTYAWQRLETPESRTDSARLLSSPMTQESRVAETQLPQQKTDLVRLLAVAPPGERRSLLVTHIQGEVAKVLGLDLDHTPEPQQGFFEMGMDSLMALDLKRHLQTILGLSLPSTLAFDYPTIDSLAAYLIRDMLSLESTGQPVQVQPTGPVTEEPIAIIGMGCRFPGGANEPAAFWQLLRNGVDGVREVPAERWNVNDFYDPDPDAPRKMYTRYGGFLDIEVDKFDARFFGITPREAVSMDPQQRLLLEVSWEALENAGQVMDKMAGSKTGVFVGINTNDYIELIRADNSATIDAYVATGNTFSIAAGRLSYFLGLQGPSIALDTACSSSLVTVHLACQSLRKGECNMALAGGVNLMLSPVTTIAMSKLRALSPDGRCKTFDAAADGYGRGEGCGIVVLKRLSDAVADGDPILALIRGSAVNQDGRSSGLTVPNGPAQQSLLREALAEARIEPVEVSYVDAHGTGTPLGDPIELQALNAVLGQGRAKDQPLMVGSVKTNIGHLEAAAGVAGLIKVVLALQHEEIPPHLHLRNPNPYISWDEIPMSIPTTLTPWPSGKGRRIAGVSSFGFSGTNAHVIVEEAPSLPRPIGDSDDQANASGLPRLQAHLLLLSARSPQALQSLARKYQAFLVDEEPGARMSLQDICYTASVRRTHHDYRLALVGHSHAQLAEQLAVFLRGAEHPNIFSGRKVPGHQPKLVKEGTVPGSLRRDKEEREAMLEALGKFYSLGYSIDWVTVSLGKGQYVPLLTYEWQRERYWIETRQEKTDRGLERISDWLYDIVWQPRAHVKPQHTSVPSQTDGGSKPLSLTQWLIFADQSGLGAELAALLEKRGQNCLMVFPGKNYDVDAGQELRTVPKSPTFGAGHRSINPANPEDFQRLLRDVLETNSLVVAANDRKGSSLQPHLSLPRLELVYLWSLETAPPLETTLSSLEEAHVLGCGGVLHLVQALVKTEWSIPPRLWLVSRGVQPAGPESRVLTVAQAPLWGIGKVVALEHPDLWGGLIDLDHTVCEEEAQMLLEEVWEPDGEDQIAFRGEERYVSRLMRSSELARTEDRSLALSPRSRLPEGNFPRPLSWRSDGTYLITGGLGSLGLKIASWIVEQGARHLMLTGRRGLPDRSTWQTLQHDSATAQKITAIQALEAAGAIVQPLQADVAELDQMSAALEPLGHTQPPLRGIIHAAGVLKLQTIQGMDLGTLKSVLRPKVTGAWVLHQLTREMDLDFFVSFSSAAAVWGSAQAGHYVAANHFLDILAHHRHALGLPASSINWGWWEDSDIVPSEAKKYFTAIGLNVIPQEQGLDALGYLLKSHIVQKTVAMVDWSKYKPVFEAKRQRPFLNLIEAQPLEQESTPSAEGLQLIRRLKETPASERLGGLVAYIRAEVVQIMGLDPSYVFEPQQGFFQIGMDSLMAVELKTCLETRLGHTLPPTVAFEYPTVEALASYIAREVLVLDESESRDSEVAADPRGLQVRLDEAMAELEGSSKEDLISLLADELKKIDEWRSR